MKCTSRLLFTYVHTHVTTTQTKIRFQKLPHAPSKAKLSAAQVLTLLTSILWISFSWEEQF